MVDLFECDKCRKHFPTRKRVGIEKSGPGLFNIGQRYDYCCSCWSKAKPKEKK